MSNLARTIHKNEEIESGTALISKKIPVMLVPFFEGSDYTLEQTSTPKPRFSKARFSK